MAGGWKGFQERLVDVVGRLGPDEATGELGDFTTSPRVLLISGIAIVVGVLSAFVALALLRLIGLFTNLFFFGRWNTALVSPAGNHLGVWEVFIPAGGALVVGLMARYGSERIRGHGIPEAIESILMYGSRIQPRVAILKPIASALSIGSGGPFGAEGPIIMTGGAFGSLLAQFMHLTSAERKTLLVAGAAGGMAATFNSPIAAVLLAVELLLFEWKPRSLIPVALASATAALLRYYLLGGGPLFPTPPHPVFIGIVGLLGCVLVGLSAGALSGVLTIGVYAAEDAFHRLPIHWMWWPAIGGLVVGIGGLIFPEALGVGYSTIGSMLQGNVTGQIILGILIVKSVIWVVSLGSGTSGGVLAPLLLMGGALGGIEAGFLPQEGAGFWPLISMAAILGGTMRSPFTGIIFALELTHDVNALLPLLVATVVAHGFTVLGLRRSILTEKISRRGYHMTREYAIDPLEILFVREVMHTNITALPAELPLTELVGSLHANNNRHVHRAYPVIGEGRELVGLISGDDLQHWTHALQLGQSLPPAIAQGRMGDLAKANPVVAYPDESLRVVVYRMAAEDATRLPVVERTDCRKLVGMVALDDLLKARTRNLTEERHRERLLRLHMLVPPRWRRDPTPEPLEEVGAAG
jgi:chloride channel protein, CIC family